jgi:hypothetical protein
MIKFSQKCKTLFVGVLIFSLSLSFLPEFLWGATIMKEKQPPSFQNVPQEEFKSFDAYILLALGLGSAGLSYSYGSKAERYYKDYQRAVTQLDMEKNYTQYKKNYRLRNITGLISLAFFGGATYLFLKKDETTQRYQERFSFFPKKIDWDKGRFGLSWTYQF